MVKLVANAGFGAVGARRDRSRANRVARLLTTTALVGVGLSLSGTAKAQSSVNPAGGGNVSATDGMVTGGGAGQGVQASGSSGSVTVNNVTITQVVPTPTSNALDVNGPDVIFTGTNSLTTTNSGGAAFNFTTNVNRGINLTGSDNSFTGSYGMRISAPSGFINVDSSGRTQTLTGNGTAVSGFDISSFINPELRFGTSIVNGFSTGVRMTQSANGGFVYFNSTGGSITATGIGINADNAVGSATIESQTAIVAPNGIRATVGTGATITTSGGGTINSNAVGTGTGIFSTSSGSGNVNVAVGAAIGGSTRGATGVNASTTGTGTVTISTTAAITANTGIVASSGAATGNSINVGALVNAANGGGVAGILVQSAGFTTTVERNVSVQGPSVSANPANAGIVNVGNASVVNNGTISGAFGVTYQNGGSYFGAGRSAPAANDFSRISSGGTAIDMVGGAAGGPANSIVHNGLIFGRIHVNSAADTTISLLSTLFGNVEVEGTGTRTTTISGSMIGNYTDTGGNGADMVSVASSATFQGDVSLGGGNDMVNYSSRTLTSTANQNLGTGQYDNLFDGGAGNDMFNVAAAFPISIELGNLTNFETYALKSGNLTLTGSRSGGAGWNIEGGILSLSGNLVASNVAINASAGTQFNVNSTGVLDTLANGGVAIQGPASGAFAIVNAGSIGNGTSGGNTIQAGQASLTLTNSGNITTPNFVAVLGGAGSTITNSGTITGGVDSGGFGHGVQVNGVGTVTNQNGGTIGTSGNYGVRFEGAATLNNNLGGLIVYSGGANRTGAAASLGGGGTVNNLGTIDVTGASGQGIIIDAGGTVNNGSISNTTALIRSQPGTGVLVTGNIAATTNNFGRIEGGNGIVHVDGGSGALAINNLGSAAVIYGTSFSGIVGGLGGLTVQNAGLIAAQSLGGFNAISSSGPVTITNTGTIGTGTVSGAGAFTTGGSGAAISTAGNTTVINNGTLYGGSYAAITNASNSVLTVTNRGAISSGALGDALASFGSVNVLNAGTVSTGVFSAVNGIAGGTVVNAAGGTLTGGNNATFGEAVQFGTGTASFTNYGSASSAIGKAVFVTNSAATTINLHAGSTTGSIQTGSGNDVVAIYSGRGNSGLATVDAPSGIVLQNAGTLAGASVGAINLGGGTDTIILRGTGDGTAGNGATGSFNIGTGTGVETLTKTDGGIWTLTGAAATPGIRINAGDGGVPGSDGLLIFSGTTGLTGDIYVNAATIRANTAGAFGTGTIYAVDPTIQYGATGTYANNIVLASIDPVGDPTRIQVDTGITATLTGLISQSGAPAQPLIFDGFGTARLTNAGNNYAGLTTISNGTVVEVNTGSALGSGGVLVNAGAVLQFDNQTGGQIFLEGGTYSGAGTIRFTGNAGSSTVIGFPSNVTISQSSGGLVDVISGSVAGSSNNQGFWTGNQGSLNIASGAIFDGVEGNIIVDRLTGSGTLRGGFFGSGSTTIGIANGSATFSGIIADSTNASSPLTLIKAGTGTQTLTGVNTYTGLTNILGGTLEIRNGAAIANTGTVNVQSPGIFAVTNAETIGNLTGNGSTTLAANLTLGAASGNYAGTVSGAGALALSAGSKTFSGALTNAGGLTLSGTAATTFTATGSIVNANTAITTVGTANSVTNNGSITGSTGVRFATGSVTLTNNGTGTIAGGISAVQSDAAVTSTMVSNAGQLLGNANYAIRIQGGSLNLENLTGGNIGSASGGGINFGGTTASITNRAGATIAGATNFNAIQSTATMAILNQGTISTVNPNFTAIFSTAKIDLTNASLITGGYDGVRSSSADSIVTNSGTINGTQFAGVRMFGGGTVINSGNITGGQVGIDTQSAAATIINNGTVSGNVFAIRTVGNFADTVTLGAVSTTTGGILLGDGADIFNLTTGAVVSGTVDGGTGFDAFIIDGTGSSNIAGNVTSFESLTKNGTGTVTLSGNNGAFGTVTINAGNVNASGGNAIADSDAVVVNAGGDFGLLANEAIGSLSGAGNVSLNANTLTLGGDNSSTVFAGIASGTGGLTKIGTGVFTISGANSYTGITSIQAGTLQFGANDVLSDSTYLEVLNGATLDLNGFSDTVGTFALMGNLTGGGTLTANAYNLYGGTLGMALGAGTVNQISGTTLVNGTIDAANISVQGGMLQLGLADRLSDSAALSVNTLGTIDLQGFDETVGGLISSGSINGTGTLTAATYEFMGGTVNANLGAGVVIQSSGSTLLNGTSTAATVNVNGGSLMLGMNERLADTAALTISAGGTLNLAALNDTIGSATIGGALEGTGTLTAANYSLTGGVVNANLGLGVLAQNSGSSVLNGTSGAGSVQINGGTLTLGSSERLADTASLLVGNGATLTLNGGESVGFANLSGTLGGTGTLTAVNYQLNGATVNADMGSGNLFQIGGISILNGTSAASFIGVNGGNLTLGANERLDNGATLSVNVGGTLNLQGFDETVDYASISGQLDGSGTLTAATYNLNDATVNANLGAGLLTQSAGTSTLNGTAAAGSVVVSGGSLELGASERLADNAEVNILTAGTLDLGAYSETVGSILISGTLNGTGTLTAATPAGNGANYTLNGGTANANLGAGILRVVGNVSTLNGTSDANSVLISSGTLTLGASDRLADTADVAVNTGSALNLGANDDTIGTLLLSGTLGGTGTLTAATYALDGGVVNANLGAGTLISAGASVLNGTVAAGAVSVSGGSLTLGAAERLSDRTTLVIDASGALDLGAFVETVGVAAIDGTLNGTGILNASQYQLTGATVNANLGAGTLLQLGGTSVLNGTAAASQVGIRGGTLALGASDRLLDTATLVIDETGALDLGAFVETVGTAAIGGTLNGSGILNASLYQLDSATVNGNLGAGSLVQNSGISNLTGLAGAETVNIVGGTLVLGSAERLSDAAVLSLSTGTTLTLNGDETVGVASLAGTLGGVGTLAASSYLLSGAIINADMGSGTLVQNGANSTLNGTAAASIVSVQNGTLQLGAAERLLDSATLDIDAAGTLDLGAFVETVSVAAIGGTLNGTGTLNASQYQLNGATVNADLGAGTLFQLGGTSTINSTVAASQVLVQNGTLRIGAAERLANSATLVIDATGALDLGAFAETVGVVAIGGVLNGTGTLNANQYQLNGARVNANLGAGTLLQRGGTSVLNGTVAASQVVIQNGTLRLGVAERVDDSSAVMIDANGTFELDGFQESIGSLFGTGRLALGAAALNVGSTNNDFGFGGSITDSGDLTKTGTGTFTLLGDHLMTGRLNVNAGTMLFLGSTAGSARILGGTLSGAGRFAGNLLLSSGTLSPGTAAQPVATFQAGSFTATGGNYAVDFTGSTGNFTSDLVLVTGAVVLSGGTVAPHAVESSANYRVNQEYLIVKGSTVTGTFGNGESFTRVTGASDLFWRLRYDLMPNSVLLEVRKAMDFTVGLGAGATPNQSAVGTALNGSGLSGSDNWVGILDAITDLTPAQLQAAYDSISGEALSDISTMAVMHGNRFNDLLRDRVSHGTNLNTGDISMVAAAINGSERRGILRAAAPVASNTSALSGDGSGAAAWMQGFGSSGQLDGDYNTASVENFAAGIAAGVSFDVGNFKFGVAGAYSDVESSVDARLSRNEGKLYQAGAYVGYDDGSTFASAVGSYFGGAVETTRNIVVNPALTSQATGDVDIKGYAVGGSIGYRFELGDGLVLSPQLSGDATQMTRDAFTETGAGALSLAVAREQRTLYSGTGEARLSHRGSMANGGVVEPYVSVGVRVNFGDLDTLSNMRYTGAPAGAGAFIIEGARLAKTSALFGGGINARPSENVTIGVDVASTVSGKENEGRFSVNFKIGF